MARCYRCQAAVATPRPAPASCPGGSRAIGSKASDRLHRAPRSEPVSLVVTVEVRAKFGIDSGPARLRGGGRSLGPPATVAGGPKGPGGSGSGFQVGILAGCVPPSQAPCPGVLTACEQRITDSDGAGIYAKVY